jgi:hypothetical protein
MNTISDRERLAKRRRLYLVSSHTGLSHADLASGFIADGIYDDNPGSLLGDSSIPTNYRREMTSPASGNVLPLMLPECTPLCLSSLHERETHSGGKQNVLFSYRILPCRT